MIEYCEKSGTVDRLVACMERSQDVSKGIIRTLMFMGFKTINHVKEPELIPKSPNMVFMVYRFSIENA